jgi:hypothetical protein
MLIFFQIDLFSEVKKHMYLSKENHLCKKLLHLAHCFPVTIEFILNGILPTNLRFYGAGWLNLLQICLFSNIDETHVSLKGKPSVLEVAASNTLFPCKN